MDYPRCQTCDYWERSFDDGDTPLMQGHCHKIGSLHKNRMEEPAWIEVVEDLSGDAFAVFVSEPHFGCPMHSDLEEEPGVW